MTNTHTQAHTECMHTSRTIRNAGTISIYLLFCNRENIWGTKYEVNSGGTFDQLFIWIFLWNFHRSCLFNSAKPWCKKVKNDQKLKSRGPALTFEQRMPWSWNWHISFPLSFFFNTLLVIFDIFFHQSVINRFVPNMCQIWHVGCFFMYFLYPEKNIQSRLY